PPARRAGRNARLPLLALSPPAPPAPGCTLFPYTTLFRSVPLGVTSCALGKELMVDAKVWGDAFLKLPENAPKEWIHVYTGERFADRKSTRLNSSHVKTSYAVFCLKENTRAWRPLRSSETH